MKNPTKIFFSVFILTLILSASTHAQWTWVGSIQQPISFPSISVCAPDVAWIATGTTNQGKIWRTTNGGVNWTLLNAPTGPEPYAIWAIDANTAFIGDGGVGGGGGGNALVYKTTNGGVNWINILSTGGSAGFINGIVFSRTTPSFGVIESDPPLGTGTPYWVAITTNGGNNWTVTNPPGVSAAASAQNSIVVIDNLYFGFGLNAGAARVYFTTNGGTNWTLSTLGLTGTAVFVSGFAVSTDKQFVIATGSANLPSIARSTNGGTSFSVLNTGAGVTGYCTMQWIHGSNICYLSAGTGAAGCIKRSSNAGVNWTQMSTGSIFGGTSQHLDYFKEANNVIHLYMIATDGSVIRYRDSSLLVGINVNTGNVPNEYKLEQNYPNPFNPATTINYSLPKASHVTLKIYDVLGNEVMAIVNEYKNAGSYSASVDGANLSSGVYFYRLEAGNYTDTRKMTLLK
jgi:photosystem II stability/assembly factor-like uncharacterized protein